MTAPTPISPPICNNAKWAFTARRVKRTDVRGLSEDFHAAKAGDLLLCEIAQVGHHKRIQLAERRLSESYLGDLVVLCVGDRYAPDQFLASAVIDRPMIDLVAGGGIAGRVDASHELMEEPMQEPFSMIAIESSKYLGLMERPLASGLGVGYGLGIRANLRGERWALTTGAFAPVTDVLDLADDSDDDALDLRFTSTPLRAELAFIHIGVSASWRWPEADTLRFSLRPETTLVQDLDINHPRQRDVSRYRLTGLEFAWRAESLLLQSEYFRADIQRADHRDPTFTGYYVQLSWALTGEVDVYVGRVRRKIGKEGDRIVTLRNVGYRMS